MTQLSLAMACCCVILLVTLLTPDAAAADEPEATAVRPFRIEVSDDVLADLQQRLARTRFPQTIDEAGWEYGTDLQLMRDLVAYWRDEYDWRKHERQLNELPQFKTHLDGLDVHFIHVRSPHPDAVPLLLTHGWPGSVYEFIKVIGPLTDPVAHGGRAEDAFHVVCPSLPGFGFSDPPREPGWHVDRMAATIGKLMARLGYDRYVAQGGDWGAHVTSWLGRYDAEHVIAIHLNYCSLGRPAGTTGNAGASEAEVARFERRRDELDNHRGYGQIQGTRPQTLSFALNDSPAGLAAWIVDKFYVWSDPHGKLENSFTKDELLTNVMIYWVTGTAGSSARIYYETRQRPRTQERVEVPVGVALFPREIVIPPRKWAEARFNITHWTEMPRGGHFAALEQPQLLVEDVRKFVAGVRGQSK